MFCLIVPHVISIYKAPWGCLVLGARTRLLEQASGKTGELESMDEFIFQELWNCQNSKENPVCKQQTMQMLAYVILRIILLQNSLVIVK